MIGEEGEESRLRTGIARGRVVGDDTHVMPGVASPGSFVRVWWRLRGRWKCCSDGEATAASRRDVKAIVVVLGGDGPLDGMLVFSPGVVFAYYGWARVDGVGAEGSSGCHLRWRWGWRYIIILIRGETHV